MLSALDEAIARHGLDELVSIEVRPALASLTELLIKHGRRSNLVGTTELHRLLDEVIVDALQVLTVAPGGRIIDVGSGAGIPVLPLAIARPSWQFVSLEPRAKRVMFQQTVRRALGLTNLQIVEGRVGDGGELPKLIEPGFDGAISKAVFAPEKWATVATALVGESGWVATYANAGASPAAEATVHAYALADGRQRLVWVASSRPD
ncbi:MAG: 16S rRNA (guanine527-N7)-methyltransferase [Flavobacteriales bacterium]